MRALKIGLKVILMLAIFTLLVMLLWNWLIPSIFAGPAISYVQAFGLIILAKILLSPIGRGFGRHNWKMRHHHWKEFEEKMSKMSEEEREKYKADIKNRCRC